jgi:hypothetical protein
MNRNVSFGGPQKVTNKTASDFFTIIFRICGDIRRAQDPFACLKPKYPAPPRPKRNNRANRPSHKMRKRLCTQTARRGVVKMTVENIEDGLTWTTEYGICVVNSRRGMERVAPPGRHLFLSFPIGLDSRLNRRSFVQSTIRDSNSPTEDSNS